MIWVVFEKKKEEKSIYARFKMITAFDFFCGEFRIKSKCRNAKPRDSFEADQEIVKTRVHTIAELAAQRRFQNP